MGNGRYGYRNEETWREQREWQRRHKENSTFYGHVTKKKFNNFPAWGEKTHSAESPQILVDQDPNDDSYFLKLLLKLVKGYISTIRPYVLVWKVQRLSAECEETVLPYWKGKNCCVAEVAEGSKVIRNGLLSPDGWYVHRFHKLLQQFVQSTTKQNPKMS